MFKLATSSNTRVVGGAGDTTIFGGAGGNVVYLGAGSSTVVEGADADTLDAGSGPATIYGGSGGTFINAGSRGLTLIAGAGPSTIQASASPAVIFGPNGSDVTIDGNDISNPEYIWIGAPGLETIDSGNAGPGGLLFGNNGTNLTYTGNGDVTWFSGAGAETVSLDGTIPSAKLYGHAGGDLAVRASDGLLAPSLIAGAGNETLNGAGVAGGCLFYSAAAGNDTLNSGVVPPGSGLASPTMIGGPAHDVFFINGYGAVIMTGGGGADQFDFSPISAGGIRTAVIVDFTSIDEVDLGGYEATYRNNMIASQAAIGNGSTILQLKDGTQILLQGYGHLTPNQILR